MKKIILASTSPRRKEILEKLKIPFEVIGINYEEDMALDMSPEDLVMYLATGKFYPSLSTTQLSMQSKTRFLLFSLFFAAPFYSVNAFGFADLLKQVQNFGGGENATVRREDSLVTTDLSDLLILAKGKKEDTIKQVNKEFPYCKGGQSILEKTLDEKMNGPFGEYANNGENGLETVMKAKNRTDGRWGNMYGYTTTSTKNKKIAQFFPIDGSRRADYEKMIDKVLQITPMQIFSKLKNVLVYDSKRPDLYAMMDVDRADNKFTLTLSKTYYSDELKNKEEVAKKIEFVVHEYGHLLFTDNKSKLSKEQMEKKDCKEYFLEYRRERDKPSLGFCVSKTDISAKFDSIFWSKKSDDERSYGSINYDKNYKDSYKESVFRDHVSEYATANSIEDMAESFMHYVLETDLTDKKGGQALAKIKFFELNWDLGKGIDLRKIKREFRDLIGKSEYCKELSQ